MMGWIPLLKMTIWNFLLIQLAVKAHNFEGVGVDYLQSSFYYLALSFSLQEEGRLPFSFNRIGLWWEKSTEIDIVAYDSLGSDICFGECKFRNEKLGVDVFESLSEKSKKVE